MYQRHSRQWSRFDSVDLLLNQSPSPAVDQKPGGTVGGLTLGADWTFDGSLRSTASWDSAIEASLIGSNSSTLAGTTDVGVQRRRDAPFPPLTADVRPSTSGPAAVSVDPPAEPQSCDSDRSSLGGDGSSPGLRRSAAGDRLRGACRSVLRRVENKMKRRGSTSPTPAAVPSSSPMEISSPTVVDEVAMRARMDALRCVDLASNSPLPAGVDRSRLQHSAPATPTNERYSPALGGETSVDVVDHRQLLQRRGRQRSLDSARVSVYDNVVTPPTGVSAVSEDDPQRQLDAILSSLYRDIGILSTSLAVVDEERNGTRLARLFYITNFFALKLKEVNFLDQIRTLSFTYLAS